MSKRAGPPLFELLRARSEEPPAAAAPVRRDPDPSVPWTGAGVTRAERSAAALDDEPRSPGELRIPVTRVYMAVAVAMLLVVGAWAAGHHFGVKAGRAQIEQVVGNDPVVLPPTQAGAQPAEQPGSRPVPGPTGTTTPPTAGRDPGPAAPAPSGAWVLGAGGARVADPRMPGANYLALATLPEDQTKDAIDFLAAKGLRTIGVPVDTGRSSGNNPARYTLISLGLAVPSERYGSSATQREEHERLVATLGAEWRRERRGGSDFSRTQWIRYNP